MRQSEHKRFTHSKRFIDAARLGLLQRALAPWPRRQAPLLDINCGDGFFLPLLWRSGFDLVATEPDINLIPIAYARKIPDLEIYSSSADDLPFEDDNFDWVILHLRDDETNKIQKQLEEALRVCKRGIMITFWNNFSLAGMAGRSRLNRITKNAALVAWFKVWKGLRKLNAGKIRHLSTLCFLPATWNQRCPLAFVNWGIFNFPLGAWCIMRLDLGPSFPLTPLALRWNKALRREQPALEYTQKIISPKKITPCR